MRSADGQLPGPRAIKRGSTSFRRVPPQPEPGEFESLRRVAAGHRRGGRVARARAGYRDSIDRFSLMFALAGSLVLTIAAVILIGSGGLFVLTSTGILGIVLLIEEDLISWARPGTERAADGPPARRHSRA